jgi:hypothetical protein
MSFAALYLVFEENQLHKEIIQVCLEIQSVPLPACRLISRVQPG